MFCIPLSLGLVALVDEEDYAWASQWKWHASKGRRGSYYARRNRPRGERAAGGISLHREIAKPLPGQDVDHIDGDTLNNTRANLRCCTHQQNCWNSRRSCRNISGYKGVSWSERDQHWRVLLRINGRNTWIGAYDSAEAGAAAYDAAVRRHRGAFGLTNGQMAGKNAGVADDPPA